MFIYYLYIFICEMLFSCLLHIFIGLPFFFLVIWRIYLHTVDAIFVNYDVSYKYFLSASTCLFSELMFLQQKYYNVAKLYQYLVS